MGGTCFKLRFRERELWLVPGTYDIGRGSDCHLRIDDTRVSRRHAQLVVKSATQALIRDCGSVNGVSVDGARVGGEAVQLAPGSRVAIGKEVIAVQAPSLPPVRERLDTLEEERRTEPGREESTIRDKRPLGEDLPRAELATSQTAETRRTDALELYAPVARSAIAMGRADDAEALMGAHLRAILAHVVAGATLGRDTVRNTVEMAVDLARAGQPGWFDFVVEMYEALKELPPGHVVSGLERALEAHAAVDTVRLGRWIRSLRGRIEDLDPLDLDTLDRLEAMVGVAIRRGA